MKIHPLPYLAAILGLFFHAVLPSAKAQQQVSDQEFLEQTSYDQELVPGTVVVLESQGPVELIDAEGKTVGTVAKRDKIMNGFSIATGPGAVVDLAFSTGLLMQIQENSRFTIADFVHEPYEMLFSKGVAMNASEAKKSGDKKAVINKLHSSSNAWNEMKVEPRTATSEFTLHYGTMIGVTKKLQPASRLSIVTPIGTADIRGTIWRLTVIPAGNGFYRGTLDVSRGRVTFSTPDGSRSVNVNNGFSSQIAGVSQGDTLQIDSLVSARLTPERISLLDSTAQNLANNQDYFVAINGDPAVVETVLSYLSEVSANDPEAFSEAVSSLAQNQPADAAQIAAVAAAYALVNTSPANISSVISQAVSSIITAVPSATQGIISSTFNVATNSGDGPAMVSNIISSVTQSVIQTGINLASSQNPNGKSVLSSVVAALVSSNPSAANQISEQALTALSNSALQSNQKSVIAASIAQSAIQASAQSALKSGADINSANLNATSTASSVQQSADSLGLGESVSVITEPSNVRDLTIQAGNSNTNGGESGNQGLTVGSVNDGGDTGVSPNLSNPGPQSDPAQGSTGGTTEKPVPTPRPTATPIPTATPRPTATSRPTATPKPTPTPRPSGA